MKAARIFTPVATAIWAGALASCEPPTSAGVADAALTQIDSDYVSYEMRSFLTTEGVRSGTVYADTAFVYEDSATARLFGFQMTIFDERGVEQAFVVADSGRLNQRTEEMTAWGEVVVDLPARSCRITTTEIQYDPPGRQIRTDAPVRFEQGGRVATGNGFVSDLMLESFRIQQLVGPFNICSVAGGGP
jgi:LPS export ABC transporter protein LptC